MPKNENHKKKKKKKNSCSLVFNGCHSSLPFNFTVLVLDVILELVVVWTKEMTNKFIFFKRTAQIILKLLISASAVSRANEAEGIHF